MENKNTIEISGKIILYIIIGILILGIIVMTFFPGVTYAVKDFNSNSPDKCKPQQGYTEEAWREHMGHHPDIYKECLNK